MDPIFEMAYVSTVEYYTLVQEAEVQEHLKIDLLDVEDFIKKNKVEEIDEPLFFVKNGVPTARGLLSNEIFGITKDDRSNIFGYIDLHGWYMHPAVYKIWGTMDKRIRAIVHGTQNFSLDKNGYIVEDENGSSGVEFLRKNIDKIRIEQTGSGKRENITNFIYKVKDKMFIKKMLVIPAMYRDVNTTDQGNVGVGSINKYYQSLIISVRSILETQEYGFSMSAATAGRIQETLLNIYNVLCGTSKNKDDGIGLSTKRGIIRSAVMSKTTDYGARLVLSAPELKVESVDDMLVDIDHAGLPLASACVNFYPFIVFYVKRLFENMFDGNNPSINIRIKSGKIEAVEVQDPLVQFSDDVIRGHIKEFVYGYSNRLQPVEIKLSDGRIGYLRFAGRNVAPEQIKSGNYSGESSIVDRRLTWCDIFYMAATEACRDKYVLITRFPMDTYFNQFSTKVRITTLKHTENVIYNGTHYPFYPKIREGDIGTNTSNMFRDTLTFSMF